MTDYGDDIRPRDLIPPPPPRDRTDPYLYDLTLTIVVKGDGQHSDGRGATATARRLAAMVTKDPQVTAVSVTHPHYRGPNA